MKLVVENSISYQIIPVLSVAEKKWGIDVSDTKFVDDITTEPYQQIDFTKDGRQWKLIFPVNGDTVFFIDYNLHKDKIISYAGGAVGDGNRKLDLGDKVAIVVYGNESQEVLELRFIHELLHAQDLPADDLVKYAFRFMTFWEWLRFRWQQYKKQKPEHYPFWQRKFYRWLLLQRQKGKI